MDLLMEAPTPDSKDPPAEALSPFVLIEVSPVGPVALADFFSFFRGISPCGKSSPSAEAQVEDD
jgi:hypothetical protein